MPEEIPEVRVGDRVLETSVYRLDGRLRTDLRTLPGDTSLDRLALALDRLLTD